MLHRGGHNGRLLSKPFFSRQLSPSIRKSDDEMACFAAHGRSMGPPAMQAVVFQYL